MNELLKWFDLFKELKTHFLAGVMSDYNIYLGRPVSTRMDKLSMLYFEFLEEGSINAEDDGFHVSDEPKFLRFAIVMRTKNHQAFKGDLEKAYGYMYDDQNNLRQALYDYMTESNIIDYPIKPLFYDMMINSIRQVDLGLSDKQRNPIIANVFEITTLYNVSQS